MRSKLLFMSAVMLIALQILGAQSPLSHVFGSGAYTDSGQPAYDVLAYSDSSEQLIVWENGALSYQPMQTWIDDQGLIGTVHGSQPYPYIGFKRGGTYPRINPVFWNQSTTPPLAAFAEVATDPAGDHLFTNPALDLLRLSVAFSDDKLHFTLQNSSGTYPTGSGAITYYAYMALIIDPAATPETNPIVYSLMYTVNVTGVIGPGLYKITGSGLSDQTLLGQITQSVVEGKLVLSCNLSDLTADPDFSSWFDPDYPLISVGSMTTRITLTSGVQEADSTTGAEILLRPQLLPVQNLAQPVLNNARVDSGWVSDVFYVQGYADYTDADNNFPRWATFSLDGGEPQALHILTPFPMAFDQYPVHFVSQMVPASPDWNEARFRFAHGDSYVETVVLNQVSNSDYTIPVAPLRVSAYPNPVNRALKLEVTGVETYDLSVYNLKGQRLLCTASTDPRPEIDLSAFPAGIYMIRINSLQGSLSKRIVKIR